MSAFILIGEEKLGRSRRKYEDDIKMNAKRSFGLGQGPVSGSRVYVNEPTGCIDRFCVGLPDFPMNLYKRNLYRCCYRVFF